MPPCISARPSLAKVEINSFSQKKEFVYVAHLAPRKELVDFITSTVPSIVRHSQISKMFMYGGGGSALGYVCLRKYSMPCLQLLLCGLALLVLDRRTVQRSRTRHSPSNDLEE